MSPRPPVRERIVQAALELAQTVGMQGMSQARVATSAGVRQSHLTYYFPTRADLIKATVQAIRDQMLDLTRTTVGADLAHPVEALRHFCVQEVQDPVKARLILSLMLVAEEEPSLHTWIDAFDQEMKQQWLEIYRAVGIAADASDIDLFHATFVGAALLAAQTGSDTARQQAIRVINTAFDRLLERR